MKTKVFILSLAVMFVFSNSLPGQIGGMIKNKASEAIGKIGKKTAKDASQQADSIAQQKAREEINRQAEESRQQKGFNLGGLTGGKVTLKYKDEYTFRNYMYMQTDIHADEDVLKMDYYIYFNDNDISGCVETKMVAETDEGTAPINNTMIFDGSNKCMIMLTEIGATRMGMISEVPDETSEEQEGKASVNTKKGQLVKTGNSRIIAGYRCDEYIYREQGEKGYGKMWYTSDLKMKTDRRTMNASGLPRYYNELPQDGAVLAMEMYDEKNKLVMKSETKEIKSNISHTVSTAGYPMRQINFNQMQSQPGRK